MCPFKEVIKPRGYDHFHPVVSFTNQASRDGLLLPRDAALFPEPSVHSLSTGILWYPTVTLSYSAREFQGGPGGSDRGL